MDRFEHQLVARIADFLVQIGIPVRSCTIEGVTDLPGVTIEAGGSLVDES